MKWLSFIFITILLLSCKKDSQFIDTQKLALNTTLDVKNIYIQSEDTLYACGGNLWSGGFVERSVDGGSTWDTLLNHWKVILSLEINSQGVIVVGSHFGGIHISYDNGQNFNYHERNDINAVNEMTFVNDSIIFITGGESFYSGGTSFFNVYDISYQAKDMDQSLACQYFFDEQKGVIGTYGTIYTTEDAGTSLNTTDASGDYFKDIEFNKNGEGLAIGYQGKIMQSKNYGGNWKKIDKKGSFFTTRGNLESLAVYENTVVICGQNGVMFLSNDLGDNWIELNSQYSNHNLYKVILTSKTEGFLCGSDGLLVRFYL